MKLPAKFSLTMMIAAIVATVLALVSAIGGFIGIIGSISILSNPNGLFAFIQMLFELLFASLGMILLAAALWVNTFIPLRFLLPIGPGLMLLGQLGDIGNIFTLLKFGGIGNLLGALAILLGLLSTAALVAITVFYNIPATKKLLESTIMLPGGFYLGSFLLGTLSEILKRQQNMGNLDWLLGYLIGLLVSLIPLALTVFLYVSIGRALVKNKKFL